ncbi:DsbA family protein [Microbacterium sp.]|uniref:DsbA family protein n=1 Tax=Microbacterium sp. TaxID=51671 RepID=UPI0039E3B7FA
MAQAAAGNRNWFAIWVSVAVVAVIAVVIALVVMMNNKATDPGVLPQASGIDQETGAVTFGDGQDVVATYVDFMCPYCNQFEQASGSTITQLIDEGRITLEIYPVHILDSRSQGTQFSSRAAAAFYAVAEADPAHSYAFMQALFKNQPDEGTTGLTDEEMIQIAKDAGVDMTDELEQTILDQKYLEFAQAQSLPEGSTGTPTLLVNGNVISITMDPETDIVANLTD